MRQKTRTVSAISADADGLVASTALTGGTPLTLLAAAAALSPPRRLLFTASDALSGILAVVGRDRNGLLINESITVPSATPVVSQYIYASVTSITPSSNDADTLEVGWDTEVISAPVMLDHFRNPFAVSIAGDVLPSGTFTVQHTFDELNDPLKARDELPNAEGYGTWFPHASIAAKSADTDGNYAFPVEAVRLVVTAGTVKMTVMQAGPRG